MAAVDRQGEAKLDCINSLVEQHLVSIILKRNIVRFKKTLIVGPCLRYLRDFVFCSGAISILIGCWIWLSDLDGFVFQLDAGFRWDG